MGEYCPKCGATLTGHYPVCVVCGGPVGDGATLPPVAPWLPVFSRAKQAPARAILAALGVLAVVGIAVGIWRASSGAPSQQDASPAVRSMPPSISVAGLGVDIYPGARPQQRTTRSTPSGSAVTALLTTSDSLDKVLDFYITRLGSAAIVSQTDQSAVFAASRPDMKTSVMVTISTETGGPTKIGILHSTTR